MYFLIFEEKKVCGLIIPILNAMFVVQYQMQPNSGLQRSLAAISPQSINLDCYLLMGRSPLAIRPAVIYYSNNIQCKRTIMNTMACHIIDA